MPRTKPGPREAIVVVHERGDSKTLIHVPLGAFKAMGLWLPLLVLTAWLGWLLLAQR